MDGGGQGAHLLSCGDGQGQFVDHFSPMAGHDGPPENFSVLLIVVDPREALILAVQDGTVHMGEMLRKGSHLDACLTQVRLCEVPSLEKFSVE